MSKDDGEKIRSIHDKLFKSVFSDPKEAVSFFKAYLPEKIMQHIDWSGIQLLNRSYVSEEFREIESDLLYRVGMKNINRSVYLYLLFEHQSSPDKWIRFRLLKYLIGIWDNLFQEKTNPEKLPPILPIVFYQGTHQWNYSTEFKDLVEEIDIDDKYNVNFSHFLIDHSGIENNQIKGDTKGRVAQLLMKAAFHGQLESILKLLAELLLELENHGGIDYIRFFVIYLLKTNENITIKKINEAIQKEVKNKTIGEHIMTIAEQLRQEGMLEGKLEGILEGKLEVIKNLLNRGFDWNLIFETTGINKDDFNKLNIHADNGDKK